MWMKVLVMAEQLMMGLQMICLELIFHLSRLWRKRSLWTAVAARVRLADWNYGARERGEEILCPLILENVFLSPWRPCKAKPIMR